MPFVYRDTDLVEEPVEVYADLLDAVAKAVTLYADDTDIKDFYAWLQQLPVNDESEEDFHDDYEDEEDAPEYIKATFEDLKDSQETQEGIIDILGGLLEIYVVNKKLWVLNNNGLLLLCKSEDDPSLAVVPLWNSKFDATSMVGCLIPFTDTYRFIYEVDENMSLVMGDPQDDTGVAHQVQHITRTDTLPEQDEFIWGFENGHGAILKVHDFKVVIAVNGNAYLSGRGEKLRYQL